MRLRECEEEGEGVGGQVIGREWLKETRDMGGKRGKEG